MFRKNFLYIFFYFALVLLLGLSFYFYSQLDLYNIVIYCGLAWLGLSFLHLLLAGRGKGRRSVNELHATPHARAGTVARTSSASSNHMAASLSPAQHKASPSAMMPESSEPKKIPSKKVNAMQDIFKNAYQNELLTGGLALVMIGHDVVDTKTRQLKGYYCQGFIEYPNGQGIDTASIINASPKDAVAGDIEILLLETLRFYWQKVFQDGFQAEEGSQEKYSQVNNLPYCFFPLSERALNEKGFMNDLKSFLKSQKISNPGLARAFSRMVFILPFTAGLYRHAENCQFLNSEGIKLAMLYTNDNTTLLNPILDDDPSLLLRTGIDFYLSSFDNLQFLQEKMGYELMAEKITSLEKLRLKMMVFNVDNEQIYNNLPHGVSLVMGKMFDKQTRLARLPLPSI